MRHFAWYDVGGVHTEASEDGRGQVRVVEVLADETQRLRFYFWSFSGS